MNPEEGRRQQVVQFFQGLGIDPVSIANDPIHLWKQPNGKWSIDFAEFLTTGPNGKNQNCTCSCGPMYDHFRRGRREIRDLDLPNWLNPTPSQGHIDLSRYMGRTHREVL